jgi:HlyD family secretion protein
MPFRASRLIFPVVILALSAAAFFWWRDSQQPEPVKFNTTTVTRGTLTQNVTATGELQPVSTVEVSSQISGLIKEVLVDYNSRVKAGDVLALIDPATYETRLRSAQAELANTTANYQLIKLNAERIKSLHARNLVSQQEADQAVAQLAQAEAQLLIRTAAVETAKVDLARCTISAPIDGLVLDRPAIAGKTVSASTSAPVLFILVNDLSQLQIKASIAEADIGNVRENQNVTFTVDAFPNQSFKGTVRQIRNQPVVQSNVVTYATIIDVNNDALTLKPGMTANVAVTVEDRVNILLIPNAALRSRLPDEVKLPVAPEPLAVSGNATSSTPVSADPFRDLLAEVGYKEVAGSRPTREQITKVRALAAERGIVLPERRRGGRNPTANPNAETIRTLYVPDGTPDAPKARPVEVKLGITDGINTEVIAGLDEKAVVITGIEDANDTAAATKPASNPFAPSGPRRF